MKKNKKKRAQSPAPAQPAQAVGKWAKVCRVAACIGAIVLVVVATLGLGSWLHPSFDPFGWKEGYLVPLPPIDDSSSLTSRSRVTLVVDTGEEEQLHEPLGPNLPTPVTFESRGVRSCLIRKAVFTYSKRFKTPFRETKAGAVICLPLNFYNLQKPQGRSYSLTFRRPVEASAGDWVAVEVAIINRRLIGWSYVGALKIYYNDNKVAVINNVVVDILEKTPEPPESRE
jgi:hypothetical protein